MTKIPTSTISKMEKDILMRLLGYVQWRNFAEAIKRAMDSCETSKTPVERHFVEVGKMVEIGSGAKREVSDYKLTRYACYLIAMNGDTRAKTKEVAE